MQAQDDEKNLYVADRQHEWFEHWSQASGLCSQLQPVSLGGGY